MALALAAGAGILAAGIAASSTSAEIKLNDVQISETKTKGIMESAYKTDLVVSGAPNAFAPIPPPPQDIKTVTDMQDWYARAISDAQLEMAKYQMRPKGDNQRILNVASDNAPFLVQKAKPGPIGDVKGSETLDTSPMVHTRHNIPTPGTPIGWALGKRGVVSGTNQADDASRRWIDRSNPNSKNYMLNRIGGVTFSDRINPWTKGSAQVNLAAQSYIEKQGTTIPTVGNLVPARGGNVYTSKSFTTNM